MEVQVSVNDQEIVVTPVGVPSPITQPYWDACRDGRLVFHRCDDCGAEVPDADVACFACLATDGQRDLVEMEGEI